MMMGTTADCAALQTSITVLAKLIGGHNNIIIYLWPFTAQAPISTLGRLPFMNDYRKHLMPKMAYDIGYVSRLSCSLKVS
jgi:hypothetical protein